MKIYAVAVFKNLKPEERCGGIRCVGFFKNEEDSVSAVEGNLYDMNDGGEYPYAVIEEVKEGIYPVNYKRQIYKYNREKNAYEKLSEEPEDIKICVNFTMG